MKRNDTQLGRPFTQLAVPLATLTALSNPAGGMIAFAWETAPDVDGKYYSYDPVDEEWKEIGGGGGTPGGSDTQVQYNDGGAFAGDPEFNFDDVAKALGLGDPSKFPFAFGKMFWTVGDGDSPAFVGVAYGEDKAPFLTFAKADGTAASPANVKENQIIGIIRGRGYDGTAWTDSRAAIYFVADGDWSAGDTPTRMEFWLTPDGSGTLTKVLTVSENGIVYSPTETGDWDPDPDNVASALDQLAERTQDLEDTAVLKQAGNVIEIGGTLPIDDNGFATIPLPSVSSLYMFLIQMRSGATTSNWIIGSCKAQATSVCDSYTKGANVDVTTGALNGTTGTDGRLTVSVHTDGNLYIENRTGAARNFAYKVW